MWGLQAVRNAVVPLFLLAAAQACADAGPDIVPTIDSTTVASADVVVRLDPARTYEYDFTTARVDSVLAALWTAGLPLEEAWRPLEDMCLDPRGPRLTVALEQPDDARMADHDFQLGTGRLACSTQLRQYVFGNPPGSFWVVGTVHFLPVEGGCWALRVNDNLQYEPLGLPAEFQTDGLEVRALLILREAMVTSCMVGRIAEVLSIEKP